ncbi:MAG: RNA-binding cell elongation regulator Jag/EloR [Actinomycetota bacterium]|nr:RNA-binding cell elongation regulator Jag/EloR [Actinomycetota bacterium]
MNRVIEAEGASTEEAIEKALKDIGESRKDVEIEVLSENEGEVGVKVKLAIRDRRVSRGIDFLRDVLREMKIEAAVNPIEEEDHMLINIEGEGMGPLIGRRGKTLDAMQFLLNTVANKGAFHRKYIILDIEKYRARRKKSLEELARKMAEKATATGKAVTLRPMTAYERKIIHSILHDYPDIETRSDGEEPYRRVTIYPKHEKVKD